ncbi:MAG: hypothetical protein HYT75_02315 [Deltaproteobacteria bacterium]|nr:hypothetical protein [Deltaproteobacteria bacterium]MBI2341789.1 hypothetical protein [Deltaproteobacteria bacterium]
MEDVDMKICYLLLILASCIMTACGDGAATLAVNPDQNTNQNATLWGLGNESSPTPPKLAITPSMMQTYKTCGKSFILCNPKIKQLNNAIYLNQLALGNNEDKKADEGDSKEQGSISEELKTPIHGPAIINQLQLINPIKSLQ